MRWVVVSCVAAAAACSFDPSGALQDGPPGGVVDAPVGAIDARPGPIDARPGPPDARPDAGFVTTLCPAGYVHQSATSPGSRYRVILTEATFAAHHADCNDDLAAGWTHLVTFGSQQEAQDAADFLFAQYFYVGAVQAPNQAAPSGGWAWFDGSAVTTAWEAATMMPQPDDQDGTEDNTQNLAIGDAGDGELQDVGGLFGYSAVCECDGIPIAPGIAAWIPGD